MALEAQNNPFTSVLMVEAADPEAIGDADPAAGQRRLVVGTDHLLYLLDDSGVKALVGGGAIANPLATDSLWDAAGDLVQGSGANTAAKLSAGTAGKVLTSNGAAAALTWETPAGGGAMATDALWDAAGDLAQGTGANTGAKLSAGTAGQFLKSGGAATANAWASRELDYVQFTSPVTVSATTEATANTCVTGSSVAYDGSTIVLVEFFASFANAGTAANVIVFTLYDGSSSIGLMGGTGVAAANRVPIHLAYRLTPSNASHTYSVRAYITGGANGTVNVGAGGSAAWMPGFIRITRAI